MGGLNGMTMVKYVVIFIVFSGLLLGGIAVAGIESQIWLGIGMSFCGLGGMVWMVVDSMWNRHNEELDNRKFLYDARTRFVTSLGAADPDTRRYLARGMMPEFGVEWDNEHVGYLLKDGVNTQILIAFLQVFLQDSSENEFVDLRNYNDDKALQVRFEASRDMVRSQWHRATQFLQVEGYLKRGSMVGSHTYQWTSSEHFKKLRRQYLNFRALEDLGGER